MKKFMQGPIVWLLLILVIFMMAYSLVPRDETKPLEITYNAFLQAIRDGRIDTINVTVTEVVGLFKDSEIPKSGFPRRYDFKIEAPASIEAFHKDILDAEALGQGKEIGAATASDYRFELEYKPIPETPWWMTWLPLLIPTALIVVLWYFMFRQQSGGGKVMSFGKSRARLHFEDRNKVTFERIAGADEEKEELREIVEFLKSPKRFLDLGARIPKGVLLVGPPGTGKTLLAKAVAGEASVPFFSISGSDFVEMFVGVGASRVRDLFEQAKKNAPSIIFIDEIDAVGRHRGAGLGGGHDEREQTLNQLLVEMDGFSSNEGVIIIAATNRPDILDPALLRPGRFDRQITVNYPDVKGREAILYVHAKGKPIAEDVDFKVVARRTVGFTGADLENVLNEAAILAGRANIKQITMKEIEEAITRVMMGPEKRSHIPSEKDKRITAYHEAGHAILAYLLPNAAKVHMVSIIPRGRTGGHTQMLRDEDSDYMTSAQLTEQIVVAMGGDVAEKLVLGISTTGSSEDLKQATNIARRMVTSFGMSESVGHVYLASEQEVFVGRDYGHAQNYSEQVAASIDAEIRRLLEECYQRAENLMREHMPRMHKIVETLLDKENITKEEFAELMNVDLAPAV